MSHKLIASALVVAAAATAATIAGTATSSAATVKPAGSISSGTLSCNFGSYGDFIGATGWGTCTGRGSWTLHVGCNYSPTVLTVGITQSGGTVGPENLYCWQGVNDVWITF